MEIYNNVIGCLQDYCTYKADKIYDNTIYMLNKTIDDFQQEIQFNETNLNCLSTEGQKHLTRLADITKRTFDFNKKYLTKVIEGKRGPGVITSLIDKFKDKKLSKRQMMYKNKLLSKNVFQLLDSKAEMKPADKKSFEADYDKLKKESDNMRYEYSKEMESLNEALQECITANIERLD